MLAQRMYLEIQRARADHASGKFELSNALYSINMHIVLKKRLSVISGVFFSLLFFLFELSVMWTSSVKFILINTNRSPKVD